MDHSPRVNFARRHQRRIAQHRVRAMLLAISDICADLGEAFPVESTRRKFMWRRIGHFFSSPNAAMRCVCEVGSEPNFLFGHRADPARQIRHHKDILCCRALARKPENSGTNDN
jgi:hypothetical protein